MSRYLVVANQTATCPELLEAVRTRATSDPQAEFVLLVPATPVEHLLTWEEGETMREARQRAQASRARLEEVGAKVIEARVGDADPFLAIGDELRERPIYDAIILSTFPLGVSRWLGLDLPNRVKQQYSLPVIHVVADRRRLSARQASTPRTAHRKPGPAKAPPAAQDRRDSNV